MNYKIVSNNKELIKKASQTFNILNMKESIHIQDVDFWLVDVNTIDEKSLLSYKNRIQYTPILFIVNNDDEVKLCLENSFFHYIKSDFSNNELNSWCKYYFERKDENSLNLEENLIINFDKSLIQKQNEEIKLTKQECAFLKELKSSNFVSSKILANSLNLSTTTSIRTLVNRIRKKTEVDFISQKRDYGYKLNIKEEDNENKNSNSHIKELEEQNLLMQEIVDSSPTFIVTFIHKQLYCINKSFRDFLGTQIIKELWDETKGDFFQLIKHNSHENEILKTKLFTKGKHEVEIYNFSKKSNHFFEVETFYFKNLDKHLLVFK